MIIIIHFIIPDFAIVVPSLQFLSWIERRNHVTFRLCISITENIMMVLLYFHELFDHQYSHGHNLAYFVMHFLTVVSISLDRHQQETHFLVYHTIPMIIFMSSSVSRWIISHMPFQSLHSFDYGNSGRLGMGFLTNDDAELLLNLETTLLYINHSRIKLFLRCQWIFGKTPLVGWCSHPHWFGYYWVC